MLGAISETRDALRCVGSGRDAVRLVSDIWLSRLLKICPAPWRNSVRELKLKTPDGVIPISYRLNRGDLQSVREIFFAEAYRLPFNHRPRILVDLGANIGLASVWLSQTYGSEIVLAVEADSENRGSNQEKLPEK